MYRKLKLLPPMMPNFIRYEMPARKKEDGLPPDQGFDITELDPEEANAYAELMKKTFLEHYEARKSKK